MPEPTPERAANDKPAELGPDVLTNRTPGQAWPVSDFAIRPCMWCGREQSENLAHTLTDQNTGYGFECIPCLVRQRNGAQRALRKIEVAAAVWREERNGDIPWHGPGNDQT